MTYSSAARLSKSRFVAGVQCHKLLWWKVHEPDAVELQPDKVLQDRFDQGQQVGKLAWTLFPGGLLIDLPHLARIAEAHPGASARTYGSVGRLRRPTRPRFARPPNPAAPTEPPHEQEGPTANVLRSLSRDGRIRTGDPLNPIQVRYRAAPRPVLVLPSRR